MPGLKDIASSVRFSVDTARFAAAVKQLSAATQKSANEILREQAKLLVRDAAKMTPPFGNAPVTESWAVQNKIGKARVTNDLQRLFIPYTAATNAFTRNPRLGQQLKKLLQTGDIAGANLLLQRIRANAAAIYEPTEALHRAARDKRGRVRKKATQYFVVNVAAIREFISDRVRFVGLAKSGWAPAAQRLGLTLPGWITGLVGDGGIREETGDKASITVWNSVPYIQKTGADLRIMARALANRQRNFPKQVQKTVEALARKANRK